MNSSITQKNEKENKNTKRYLPHDIKTKIHAVEMYRNNGNIEYTCRKYHIPRYSLWRWNKRYDGTKESLEDKSHKPKTRHPNAHTNKEIRWIRNYVYYLLLTNINVFAIIINNIRSVCYE